LLISGADHTNYSHFAYGRRKNMHPAIVAAVVFIVITIFLLYIYNCILCCVAWKHVLFVFRIATH